jgi:hypothetical protein
MIYKEQKLLAPISEAGDSIVKIPTGSLCAEGPISVSLGTWVLCPHMAERRQRANSLPDLFNREEPWGQGVSLKGPCSQYCHIGNTRILEGTHSDASNALFFNSLYSSALFIIVILILTVRFG